MDDWYDRLEEIDSHIDETFKRIMRRLDHCIYCCAAGIVLNCAGAIILILKG